MLRLFFVPGRQWRPVGTGSLPFPAGLLQVAHFQVGIGQAVKGVGLGFAVFLLGGLRKHLFVASDSSGPLPAYLVNAGFNGLARVGGYNARLDCFQQLLQAGQARILQADQALRTMFAEPAGSGRENPARSDQDDALSATVAWYRDNRWWLEPLKSA